MWDWVLPSLHLGEYVGKAGLVQQEGLEGRLWVREKIEHGQEHILIRTGIVSVPQKLDLLEALALKLKNVVLKQRCSLTIHSVKHKIRPETAGQLVRLGSDELIIRSACTKIRLTQDYTRAM